MSLSIKQKLLFGVGLALLAEAVWWKVGISLEQQHRRLTQAEAAYGAMLHSKAVPPRKMHVNAAVERAVEDFHALFNNRRYEDAYSYADATQLRGGYIARLKRNRDTLGSVISAKLQDYYKHDYDSDDKVVVISYQTMFSSGKTFEEMFRWHVTGSEVKLNDHTLYRASGQ